MKRIYLNNILASTLLSLLMSSCIIGEISEKNEFASHELVYAYSESALYEQLYVLDMAARISAYSHASSDSARNAIKNNYFSSSTLGQTSGNWDIENSSGKWLFESNDLPIEEKGAVWKVSLTNSSASTTLIPSDNFIITATDSNTWSLNISNMESDITNRLTSQTAYENYFSFKSSGNWVVTASQPDSIQPFVYNYNIESGSGGFVPNKVESGHYNVTVSYSVKKPLYLRYNAEKYIFTTGSLLFDVVDCENEISESFQATIYTVPGDLSVSFK